MKKKHAKDLTDVEVYRRLFPKAVRDAVRKAVGKREGKAKKGRNPHAR